MGQMYFDECLFCLNCGPLLICVYSTLIKFAKSIGLLVSLRGLEYHLNAKIVSQMVKQKYYLYLIFYLFPLLQQQQVNLCTLLVVFVLIMFPNSQSQWNMTWRSNSPVWSQTLLYWCLSDVPAIENGRRNNEWANKANDEDVIRL